MPGLVDSVSFISFEKTSTHSAHENRPAWFRQTAIAKAEASQGSLKTGSLDAPGSSGREGKMLFARMITPPPSPRDPYNRPKGRYRPCLSQVPEDPRAH